MVRKTKEQALATKESILSVALDVFVAKGVARASLADIADAAGVTRGAIYWHFRNKVDIFEAMHDQLHQPVMEQVLKDLEKDHPRPLEQLQDLCVNLLLDLERNDRMRKILTVFLVKCDYSGDLEQYQQTQNAKKTEDMQWFRRYFQKAQEKGELPACADCNIMTRALCCYLVGIAGEYLRDPSFIDLETQAKPMISQFFKGIA